MKKVFYVLGIVFAAVLVWRFVRRSRATLADPSATSAADVAADRQANNRDVQAVQERPQVMLPRASWVRPNGALIDANKLGGYIPPLVTLPNLPSWNGAFN